MSTHTDDPTHSDDSTRSDGTADARRSQTVWPVLNYRDGASAMSFLSEAFGFVQRARYTVEGDPSVVVHAQMDWPLGGGIMLSSAGGKDSPFTSRVLGNDSIYVVCEDPDGLFERAMAAGAELARPMADEDYGSRGFTVRDPEGNFWSFGTYRGE